MPSLSLALACLLAFLAAAPAAAEPLAWQKPVEIAAGRGEKGPWQQNNSRYDYVDDATVALDDEGRAAVAWVDQGRKDILFQRIDPDGGRWPEKPANVSRSPDTFSWLPRLVVDPEDARQVYLLWQEIIFSGGSHGGDILFSRSRDGGANFSDPINLSHSRGGDGKGRINRDFWHNGSLDLALGPDGSLYAAWSEYQGTLWFSRSRDGGASFSPPRPLAREKKPARAPSLAVGPDGTVYLAWTVGEDPGADIRLAISRDGGASFSAPRIILPSPGYSDAPRLAVGPDGTLHLVYGESAGGPFTRQQVEYAHSSDGGRTFSPPRPISAPLPTGFTSAGYPALALDGEGNPFVLWELFAPKEGRPTAQGIAFSLDGGRTFSLLTLIPGSEAPAGATNGSQQGLLMHKLAVNRDGAVAVVNSTLRPGRGSWVWLRQAAAPEP